MCTVSEPPFPIHNTRLSQWALAMSILLLSLWLLYTDALTEDIVYVFGPLSYNVVGSKTLSAALMIRPAVSPPLRDHIPCTAAHNGKKKNRGHPTTTMTRSRVWSRDIQRMSKGVLTWIRPRSWWSATRWRKTCPKT